MHIWSVILGLYLFSTTMWAQKAVIFSMTANECTLTVESDDKWSSLRLRAHHPRQRPCAITKDEMISALGAAFLKTDPPKLDGPYSSLFIGRLIDYPFLSQELAVAAYHDNRWDRKKGKTKSIGINNFVSDLLFREVIPHFEETFSEVGYKISRVNVEKVLVGNFDQVPLYDGVLSSGLVPFDAMVWFRLEKK